ncbi:holin [Nocardia pseudobrasiliensis]|uniref:R1t family holin n=1 Tax=Nocardia pseudobrasiliensis TaxID=45979 RepID=A0A370I589_9NOCA|nr:holin [Nocardia pseudobrasiliensis]RDI65770.1 r1t family holin [Nocardia pseudobrasiliensis]
MADVFTKAGLVDAGKRALKTFAQTLAASLAVFTGVLDTNWTASLGAAGLAALISLLHNIAGDAAASGQVR